jgi:hypothetical protein
MSLPSIEPLRRQKALRSALSAVMLNHKTPSEKTTALLAAWAAGDLSLEDVLLTTKALYTEPTPS